MKADRLLSTLLLLQAHGRLTGRELAQRLEVSQRTVHRDMEALSAAGVPVFALRGPQGGWRLDEGWRTRVPALDEAELRALLMAQPRALGDARLAGAAQRALDKLVAAMPLTLREQASSIRQRLHVDPGGWYGTPEDLSFLPVVQDAVSRDKRLWIRYRPPRGAPSERTVDPLGLVAKGGSWYLVAGTAKGLRSFRVSRIERARLLETASERPRDFDLAAHWHASTEELRQGQARFEATLRLEPSAALMLRSWRATSPALQRVPETEGWATVCARFDDEDQAAFVVMGLGSRVEVLEPGSLRERVVAELGVALGRHQVSDPGSEPGGGDLCDPPRQAPNRRSTIQTSGGHRKRTGGAKPRSMPTPWDTCSGVPRKSCKPRGCLAARA